MNEDMMKALIFAPKHNRWLRKDATGAFQPEAQHFIEANNIHDGRICYVNNRRSKVAQRDQALANLAQEQDLDCVAFFCHGWSTGLQFGFGVHNVRMLGKAIVGAAGPCVTVPLYACSAARGINSFAVQLADELTGRGTMFRIDAHATRGHTTRNPYVMRHGSVDSEVETHSSGYYIVRPGGPKWTKWRLALRRGDLRLRYPFMDTPAIYKELR